MNPRLKAGPGRPKGLPNKLTTSAREAFQHAFQASGGADALATWAQKNRTQFYQLFARLIPVEHVGEGGTGPIKTVVQHIYDAAQIEPPHVPQLPAATVDAE